MPGDQEIRRSVKVTLRIIRAATVTLTLVLAQSGTAAAAEIHVWTARAMATVLADVGSHFERTTGHQLKVYSGLPADFEKRFMAGDPLDLLVSGSSPVDRWIKEGKLVAATRLIKFLGGSTVLPVIRAQGMEPAI